MSPSKKRLSKVERSEWWWGGIDENIRYGIICINGIG